MRDRERQREKEREREWWSTSDGVVVARREEGCWQFVESEKNQEEGEVVVRGGEEKRKLGIIESEFGGKFAEKLVRKLNLIEIEPTRPVYPQNDRRAA